LALFSSNGTYLVTTHGEDAVMLRDPLAGQPTTPLKVGKRVTALAFSRDGASLAVAADAEVQLWKLSEARVSQRLSSSLGAVRSLAFAPDGRTVVAGMQQGLVAWDVQDQGRVRLAFSTDQGAVESVAFSAGGADLATGGSDGTVRLWHAGNLARA